MKKYQKFNRSLSNLKSKKSQFDFVWMFAIIAGGAILALAIYGAVSSGNIKKSETNTFLAQKVSILLDPMQAGFASASYGKINFNQETEIRNSCYSEEFGESKISIATKRISESEEQNPGLGASNKNKYIFSDKKEQGTEFYVLSMPFEFPYKIADLLFLSSKKYCFYEPSSRIEDIITDLNAVNIIVTREECSLGYEKVCFGGGNNCDIKVYGVCNSGCKDKFEEGYVEKDGERIDYVGDLIYGAIISDKEIYACNIQRLFYRGGRLGEIYAEKADLINARGCNTNLKQYVLAFSRKLENASASDLIYLKTESDGLSEKNKEICGLW